MKNGLWVSLGAGLLLVVGCEGGNGGAQQGEEKAPAAAQAEQAAKGGGAVKGDDGGQAKGGEKAAEPGKVAEKGAMAPPQVHAVTAAQVADLFKGMLGDVKIAESTKPTQKLDWTVPQGCKLKYGSEAEMVLSARMEGKADQMPSQGMMIEGTFELGQGGKADLAVDYGDLRISHKNNGVKNPGAVQSKGTMAQTWLKKEGSALVEVDGPTGGWSAFGSYPGPVLFFPALPQDKTQVSWPLTIHARGSGAGVEDKRGTIKLPEGMTAPEPKAFKPDAKVTVLRWVTVNGEPAVALRAQWSDKSSDVREQKFPGQDQGMTNQITTQMGATGHYLVLANGRLLAARIDGDTQVQMKTDFPGKDSMVMHQTHKLDASVRLLEGCAKDELALKDFDKTASPQEIALNKVVVLQKALFEGNFEAAAQAFDPAIVQAHGPKLAQTLKAHTVRYGIRVFGSPEIAQKSSLEGDVVRLHLSGNALGYKTEPNNAMTVHCVYKIRVKDGQAIITHLGADTSKRDADWELIEISPQRLITAATSDPAAKAPAEQPEAGSKEGNGEVDERKKRLSKEVDNATILKKIGTIGADEPDGVLKGGAEKKTLDEALAPAGDDKPAP